MTWKQPVLLAMLAAACQGQPAGVPADDAAAVSARMVDSGPEALSGAFTRIAAATGPSVVTITSRSLYKAVVPGFPDMSSPFGGPWGAFPFPVPEEREFVREGLGSGVVISADGFIVTNNHVVEGASELEVILPDGARHPAAIVGTDPRTDLAVVRIDAGGLTPIRMGDSDSLEVGQIVLAVGSPFALSQTVTQGIVSYIGRSGVGLADYESYIQTDAAINPGNSGGALVDLDGRLVGINTAIASSTGGYDGIGFAIPSNLVLSVTSELMERGYVARGWLGVNIQDLTGGLAGEFGVENGIVVTGVSVGSPAEEAGLELGDVITGLDGATVTDVTSFRTSVAALGPGAEVELEVAGRDGRREVDVELAELPGSRPAAVQQADRTTAGPGWTLRPIDKQTASAIGFEGAQGLLVVSVQPGGTASRAGLRQGDVIVEIDREPVAAVDEVESALAASGDQALLLVRRQEGSLFVLLGQD